MTRDDAWVRLADVPASIGDFLDAVGHEPLELAFPHATWAVTRAGERFTVECYGRGGGWYASRDMSRRELRLYVDAQETVELKRPESQRPET